jgi:hypothetical protein
MDIFGYGLKYQFLHMLKDQPHFGGTNYSGKGTQKGDYLMHTMAQNKFTVLIEIKKPATDLFAKKASGEIYKYRNGAPQINYELTGAISQIQVNCDTWETEGSKSPQNNDIFYDHNIFTHKPKGILVIGHTNQLNNFELRRAFEIFRRSINNPEIITFDELFERAKYIVGKSEKENNKDIESNEFDDIDLPF